MTTQVAMPKALGGAASEETVRADLECYCELALQSGASGAVCIPAGDVIIDERVRLKRAGSRARRAWPPG